MLKRTKTKIPSSRVLTFPIPQTSDKFLRITKNLTNRDFIELDHKLISVVIKDINLTAEDNRTSLPSCALRQQSRVNLTPGTKTLDGNDISKIRKKITTDIVNFCRKQESSIRLSLMTKLDLRLQRDSDIFVIKEMTTENIETKDRCLWKLIRKDNKMLLYKINNILVIEKTENGYITIKPSDAYAAASLMATDECNIEFKKTQTAEFRCSGRV